MKLTFLGTNGWYDSNTGNTPCALLETEKYYIVLDAGFGINKLNDYLKEDKPVFIFLSHFHIDHICGLHTLPKLKVKKISIVGQKKMKKYLRNFLNHPFAASPEEFGFKVDYVELKPGKHSLPFEVACLPLKHIDPALGYRFELDNKIITYCSDTAVCENDLKLAEGADLLIHESTYQPGTKDSGWGHTNPEDAAGLAQKAGVKKIILTHLGANSYDTDAKRKDAERVARSIFPATFVAFDGMEMEF